MALNSPGYTVLFFFSSLIILLAVKENVSVPFYYVLNIFLKHANLPFK